MNASFALSATALATTVLFTGAASAAQPTGRLNDTGASMCLDAAGGSTCSNHQDALVGRDVTHPDPTDGRLGFSFQKLDAQGGKLPATAADWACVHDRVTGLMWEMKTADGSVHDATKQFTNLGDGSATDSSALVAQANAEGLCSRHDWRLPTRNELISIVDYSTVYPGPTVDADWFPNSTAYSVWTSNEQVGNTARSWYVNFMDGYSATLDKGYAFGQVRLVSGTAPAPSPRFQVLDGGAEVLDTLTGLTWQRCSVGQTWSGKTCTGQAAAMDWSTALQTGTDTAKSSGKAWRVPNVKELASISSDDRVQPSVDTATFPRTPSELFWTATPYTASGPFGAYAWTVYEYDGSATSQLTTEGSRLRLVRNK